jgi:predicted phosphodiesterase
MRRFIYAFFLMLFAAGMVSAQEYKSNNESKFVVKPYLQFATKTSIIILWETDEASSSVVEYAEEYPLKEKAEKKGTDKMHKVELTGLKPQTNYFYRVVSKTASGLEIASEVYTFQTAVNDSTAFAFAVFGDTQNNIEIWGKLAKMGWQERPNFAIHLGDIVGHGSKKSEWVDEFFAPGNVFMSRFPVYSCIGNHEGNDDNYYKYMANPEGSTYYTYTYGNTQFFVINTNFEVTKGSDQYNWLEWALAKSTAKWKIAYHHHPPYTSDMDDYGDTYKEKSVYGDPDVQDLIPLYEKYNVDIVFYGHIHDYERSWPIYQGKVDEDKGVIYIQSGGAGGGLEDYAPARTWFMQKVKRDHHFCTVAIHGGTLEFYAIDQNGVLFDRMELKKNANPNGEKVSLTPPAPMIKYGKKISTDNTLVEMDKAYDNSVIYYTMDGSVPTKNSIKYASPFTLDKSADIKAICVMDGKESVVTEKSFEKALPQEPVAVSSAKPGLAYSYYEGEWKMIPDYSSMKALKTGAAKDANLNGIETREEGWGLSFTGYIEIQKDGLYTFYTNSDDGSKLYINDKLVVNNDGSHATIDKQGGAFLKKGKHKFRLDYFEDHGGQSLYVAYEMDGIEKQVIPSNLYSH